MPAAKGDRAEVTKRVFIKTYGCQMNVYDSARMADLLAPLGYQQAGAAAGADLVILNTCHIREKAAEKVFSELGAIRRLKEARRRRGGAMLIAVTANNPLGYVLAFVAGAFAAANVVGGYVVTGRMLKMFRKRPELPKEAAVAANGQVSADAGRQLTGGGAK